MSARDEIKKCEQYLRGDMFTASGIAKDLSLAPKRVWTALGTMLDVGEIQRDEQGRYSRPKPHWINRASLSDAKGLRAARES